MSETEGRFAALRQAADAGTVAAIERLVRAGADHELNRINVIEFAERLGLRLGDVIAAFLHASRLGLFDMSWNLLCPGCGGVLDANATLKTVRREEYSCALCATSNKPTLDEMVEVSFTVNPRVRRIAAHDPHQLPIWDYQRQIYWSSGIRLPEGRAFDELIARMVLGSTELPPGEKRTLSLQLPAEFCIVFEPVTHAAQFIDVKGAAALEPQDLLVVFNRQRAPTGTVTLRPGPLRLSLENRGDQRVLPGVYVAGHDLHELLGDRRRYLTAKQLLTNQTFRDLYRADALDVDQRLKLTSLTFLFTDLKGSTEMYEKVGDLVAFDLVKAHFGALNEAVAAESGSVVKTIGDAVMATFPSPDRGLAAALRMREAIHALNETRRSEALTLKIGLHEGPCLAVLLNDRLDYFGQTVNVAARVQGLARSRSIYATRPVVEHPGAAAILQGAGLVPVPQRHALKGITDAWQVYEIP
jgi:class 3 adenylate cyclase